MFNSESPYIVILKRLGTVFLQFTKRSTIHGLNHLAQARSVKRRMFWLFISSSATLGFFINLFYLVEKFIQTPVLTNTFHDYQSFNYPDVTFCLLNPINLPPTKTPEYKLLIKEINNFTNLIQPSLNSKLINENGSIYNFPKIELSDYLFVRENLTYSHEAERVIMECLYMQNRCSFLTFKVHYIWPYGNCFTFDVNKLGNQSRNVFKTMKLNSFRPDFRLIIYKGINQIDKNIHDPYNDITKPTGMLVMIHEVDTYPHVSNSFIVDEYTQIDLKITTKSHLKSLKKCNPQPKNYTYCDIYRKNSCHTYQGKNTDCVFELVQTKLATNCNCQLHTMPVMIKYIKLPYCYNLMLHDYSKVEFIRSCFAKSLGEIDKQQSHRECYIDLCEHPTFTTVVSHSKYPAVHARQTHLLWLEKLIMLEKYEKRRYRRSTIFEKAIKANHSFIVKEKNFMDDTVSVNRSFASFSELRSFKREDLIDESFIDRNFALIRIVPSSFFMDHIEETEEYPISRLLSDIGGCVGLWVGASLITIFEFFDLLMDLNDILRVRPISRDKANSKRRRSHSVRRHDDLNSENNREDLIIGNLESMMIKMFDGDSQMLDVGQPYQTGAPVRALEPQGNHKSQTFTGGDLIMKNLNFENESLGHTTESSENVSLDLILCTAEMDIISNV